MEDEREGGVRSVEWRYTNNVEGDEGSDKLFDFIALAHLFSCLVILHLGFIMQQVDESDEQEEKQ